MSYGVSNNLQIVILSIKVKKPIVCSLKVDFFAKKNAAGFAAQKINKL